MDFISQLLNEDVKPNISPAEMAKISRIVNNIEAAIEADVGFETKGFPTDKWLAGVFRDSESMIDRKVKSYISARESGEELDKNARDGRRIYLAMAELAKRGLVYPDRSGGFTFPMRSKNDAPKREFLSKLRYYLTSGLHQAASAQDTKAVFKGAAEQAQQEWLDSLPDKVKRVADIYTNLDLQSMVLLGNLLKIDSQSDAKAKVLELESQDSVEVAKLKDLGLIRNTNTVNIPLVTQLHSFMTSPPNTDPKLVASRLRGLNREYDKLVDRSEADRALLQNRLDRIMGGETSNISVDYIKNTVADMTPQERTAVLNLIKTGTPSPQDVSLLRSIGIVDSGGELTDVGKAVANLIANRPDFDYSAVPGGMSRIDTINRRKLRAQNRSAKGAGIADRLLDR